MQGVKVRPWRKSKDQDNASFPNTKDHIVYPIYIDNKRMVPFNDWITTKFSDLLGLHDPNDEVSGLDDHETLHQRHCQIVMRIFADAINEVAPPSDPNFAEMRTAVIVRVTDLLVSDALK